MTKIKEKPTPEAKALSLFLMAFKASSPSHKKESKRMNKLWYEVTMDKLSREEYKEEVEKVLVSYGGYEDVVEKTVKFYIDKTGEWKLNGDDKYCTDAQKVADEISNK